MTSAQSIDDGYLPTDDEGHRTDGDASRRALMSSGMKEAVAPPSIDEGYEPEGTMTEEERDGGAGAEEKPIRDVPKGSPVAEDDGYHAGSDAGEATEEDQPPPDGGGGTAASRGEAPPILSPGPAALAEAAVGGRTTNEELSEGYLAEAHTEEEPSETEGRDDTGAIAVRAAGADGAGRPSPPRAAVGNVLVSTATGETWTFFRLHTLRVPRH